MGIAFDEKNEIVYSVTGNPRPALIGISILERIKILTVLWLLI